eukprot:CAMPEP_0203671444 /NCGR_PEP_ID=MMETSP0090-20130426/7233_1 /ASSEMBLY_ACC=CAM_ASM_001088 /TAXON_ID=426623 /ORGANISM="Chaetoceros affinis, Strain CCMP159" /LENGTH=799 /DNA_ID=CAMNT_0050536521 /DNA_START=369 /DNA_END=2768 /DNA_ORIENTATION=+
MKESERGLQHNKTSKQQQKQKEEEVDSNNHSKSACSRVLSSQEDITAARVGLKTSPPSITGSNISSSPKIKEEEEEKDLLSLRRNSSSLLLGLLSSSSPGRSTKRTSPEGNRSSRDGVEERTQESSASCSSQSSTLQQSRTRTTTTTTDTNRSASSLVVNNQLHVSSENTNHVLPNSILSNNHHLLNEFSVEANRHLFLTNQRSNQNSSTPQEHANLYSNIQRQQPYNRLHNLSEQGLVDWARIRNSPSDHLFGRQQALFNALSTAGVSHDLAVVNNLLGHQEGQPYAMSLREENILHPSRVNDHFIHTSPHVGHSTFRNRDESSVVTDTNSSIYNVDDHLHNQLQLHSVFRDTPPGRTHPTISSTSNLANEGIRGSRKRKQEEYSSYPSMTSHGEGRQPTSESIMISDTARRKEEVKRPLKKKREGFSEYQKDTSRINNGREFLQTDFTQRYMEQINAERGAAGLSPVLFDTKPNANAVHSLISRTNNRGQLPETTNSYSTLENTRPGVSPFFQNNMSLLLQRYGIYSQNNTEQRQGRNLLFPTSFHNRGPTYSSATEQELQNSSLLDGVLDNNFYAPHHRHIANITSLTSKRADLVKQQGIEKDQLISSLALTTFATTNQERHQEEQKTLLEQQERALQLRTVGGTGGRRFLPLGIEQDDSSRLSKFLCFIRLECIEIFTATNEIVLERMTSKKVTADQVGIRCVFCAHLPPKKKAGRSSNFPSSIARLYQGVSMMIYGHFGHCDQMPADIKAKYEELRKLTKKGDTESRSYWLESAKMKGLVDCGKDQGIRMMLGS